MELLSATVLCITGNGDFAVVSNCEDAQRRIVVRDALRRPGEGSGHCVALAILDRFCGPLHVCSSCACRNEPVIAGTVLVRLSLSGRLELNLDTVFKSQPHIGALLNQCGTVRSQGESALGLVALFLLPAP